MYTVYGIPNCDIIRKATRWLQQHNLAFAFHDYKKQGVSAEKLTQWCRQKGWETFLNKRSTTWKELGESVQQKITGEKEAILLMMEHTSLIKRPVTEKNGRVVAVGFNEKEYASLL